MALLSVNLALEIHNSLGIAAQETHERDADHMIPKQTYVTVLCASLSISPLIPIGIESGPELLNWWQSRHAYQADRRKWLEWRYIMSCDSDRCTAQGWFDPRYNTGKPNDQWQIRPYGKLWNERDLMGRRV